MFSCFAGFTTGYLAKQIDAMDSTLTPDTLYPDPMMVSGLHGLASANFYLGRSAKYLGIKNNLQS
jgi:hypothetical protein